MKKIPLNLFILFLSVTLTSCFDLESQSVFFFKDSNNPGFYDSGLAFKTPPSILEQTGVSGDKIPTSSSIVFEGSNSLKIHWTSKMGGDWQTFIIAPGFPYQNISTSDSISIMVYSEDGLPKTAMPNIFMEVAPGNSKSKKYSLGDYNNDIPAKVWTEIKFPLSVFFKDPGNSALNFRQTKAIILSQNTADNVDRTIYIDNVRTYKPDTTQTSLTAPTDLTALGYDSHVELNWKDITTNKKYEVWISNAGGAYALRKTVSAANTTIDFVKDLGDNLNLKYKIRSVSSTGGLSAFSNEVSTTTTIISDTALLTMIQRYSFRFFWDFAHPVSGMARERNSVDEVVTTGGTGFGIAAIVAAVDRGFISRAEGVVRLNKIGSFLVNAEKFHGVYPHWMNGATGKVIPFSPKDDGGDLVETSFLIQGLLIARQYFNSNGSEEIQLRKTINQIWEAVEWDWYLKNNGNVLYWHWSPNFEWQMNFPLKGYYEALITYILAAASPTHKIPSSVYHTGWAGLPTYVNGNTHYGHKLFVGPAGGGPLFFAHYSFIGFDPRNIKDKYANYFTQNINQSLINWAYCKENPGQWKGYSSDNWGLTASDDPDGYLAHEPLSKNDNGTISPTAALSSMPYTPQQSIAALKYFYRVEGAKLFGPMGFYDAYNPTKSWYADTYLAIDQGPIITMIENYRTELLWKYFMQSPEIKPALDAIGFVADRTVTNTANANIIASIKYYPNPGDREGFLTIDTKKASKVNVFMTDIQGRKMLKIANDQYLQIGKNEIRLNFNNLAHGQYIIRLLGKDVDESIPVILGR